MKKNEPPRHREHRVKNTEEGAWYFSLCFLTLCPLCLGGSFFREVVDG